MSATTNPPGPWSAYDKASIGQSAQNFYKFLDGIWDNPQLRLDLFDDKRFPYESDLKAYLNQTWNIVIPDDVRMMLVDVENARTKSYQSIDPASHPFYVMVIPPMLRRKVTEKASPSPEEKAAASHVYQDAQAWSGAWFHATNDGWGM